MKWMGFSLFVAITLIYIWNGKDHFTKKEWHAFLIKFIAVLIGSFVLVFFLVGITKHIPLITKDTGRLIIAIIPTSFMAILFSKFSVVMLCTIFDTVMCFHKNYNTAKNYSVLLSLVNRYGPGLLLLVKCLGSFGCILVFYGIWFATRV